MSDVEMRKAVNVHIVTNNTIHVTRREILLWIRSLINKDVKRIEDLSNGSVYCLLMNKLFKGCIPFNRVKFNARTEAEAVGNFKLLLNVFRDMEVRKDIPIDNLVKGVFSENFRFAQWFKLFYDANVNRARLFKPPKETSYNSDPHDMHSPRRSLSVTGKDGGWKQKSNQYYSSSPAEDRFWKRPQPSNTTAGVSLGPSVTSSENNICRKESVHNPYSKQAAETHQSGFRRKQASSTGELSDETSTEPDEPVGQDSNDSVDCMQEDNFHPCTNQQTGRRIIAKSQLTYADPSEFDEEASPLQNPCPSPMHHCIRQRNETGRSHGLSARQQLPPPSPASPSAVGSMNGRSTRRQTANYTSPSSPQQPQTSQHVSRNLLAAGDRPTSGGQLPPSNETQRHMGSSDPHGTNAQDSNEHCPTTSSGLQKFRTDGDCLKLDSSSTARISSSSPRPRGILSTSYTEITRSHMNNNTNPVQTKPPPAPSQSSSKCERNIDGIPPDELANESELQRELALLRYGTLEQRRALFFCQKEAQFYFKKLRKIEDFCYQMKGLSGKSREEDLLETIFSILYETEVSIISRNEARC
ncbi:hypothetical protein PHET_10320 [Paragonimus heterotremus]|uniref:Uncharacterized protein n=1 Tax=Paragonimus heterotremus TaxID=100268 RepID=A0A8J4T259_9TREM|nr:hypothetical protein PHET_10320 [Paragonimus heterotremus]